MEEVDDRDSPGGHLKKDTRWFRGERSAPCPGPPARTEPRGHLEDLRTRPQVGLAPADVDEGGRSPYNAIRSATLVSQPQIQKEPPGEAAPAFPDSLNS